MHSETENILIAQENSSFVQEGSSDAYAGGPCAYDKGSGFVPRKVSVLVGGWSRERDVSLCTGQGVVQALETLGHRVTVIDVTRDLRGLLEALQGAQPDVVFNALHGRGGEDGTLQGILDVLQIPYTHSSLLASAVAMDKPLCKKLLQGAGLPVIDGEVMTFQEVVSGPVRAFPYVVKPTCEGSSVGVLIIQGPEDVKKIQTLLTYERLMVEPYIPGRELSAVVLGDKALGVLELEPLSGFYDYTHKYTDQKTIHHMPARIPLKVQENLMDLALKAHETLGCQGMTRTDFRYDDTGGEPGTPYILEINTQPGLTPLSIVPDVARHGGMSYEDLVQWMVDNPRCPQ